MCSPVLLLSVLAAIDPVRIGIVALLISRPRPMVKLLAFWLGGMAAGIAASFGVLLILRGFAAALIRVAVSALSSPIAGQIQVVIGVLAVSIVALIAVRFWARQGTPVPVTGGVSSVLAREPNTPTGSRRLAIRRQLEGGSLAAAFVAGLALATPPAEYLAAIVSILASGATAAAQVGAALMFTVVAFTVAEVPLICYLATPAKTLAIMQRLNTWISTHRQAIPAVVVGAFGALLVVTGMGRI